MSLYVEISNAETFDRHLPAYETFLRRIATESGEENKVLVNMGWEPPSGLLYLIQPERDRYRRWTQGQGEIALLYDKLTGGIVGISAVEHSPLSDNISSGGNRCWLQRDYRLNNEVSKHLLASNFVWTQRQNKIGMMLTFNQYNKGIYDIIIHRTQGKKVSIGKVWSNWWDDCVPIQKKILLHNVPQWAVIKPNADRSMIHDEIQELTELYGIDE
jgi:hypothetical protein